MKNEATEYESAFAHGRQTTFVATEIEGIPHAQIPHDCALESFAHLLPSPTRIKANPEFYDVAGFADYANEFKAEGTRIFVNQNDRRFFTVFDFHAPGKPAWGDHSASLKMNLSPEWLRWKEIDGKPLSPTELAEWIEDNLEWIEGPITGAKLITMAQNLKVTLKGDLTIEQTLQAGLRHFSIRDDSVVKGVSGAKGFVFPEQVTLALRIFDNHETYPISVYLRYRTTAEKITFFFKIPDPQRLEEQAFDVVIQQVADATKLKTLKGRYEGPRHK